MIEDDLELAGIITDYLQSFDIEVTNVDSPYLGLSMLSINKEYQLLILDLTLPEIDGLELIPKIREKSNIPIIISSARDDILDKVMGTNSNISANQENKKTNIFELKEEDMQILFHNQALNLTLAEFDILKLLIQRKGGVVSREDFIYTSDSIEDDSSLKNIDVIISRIRTKLANIDKEKSHIKSVRGIGYQLI